MQHDPHYDDVVGEVRRRPGRTGPRAHERAGVPEVWIDPGIGFGKTATHNLALLAHLDAFVASGFPVLIGTSRKGFLGALLGRVRWVERRRLPSTTAWRDRWPPPRGPTPAGAAMVRAHDVRATVHAAEVTGGQITNAAA